MIKYILGLDPSGSFHEGKGTTGWCVLDTKNLTIVDTGTLYAGNFHSPTAYWNAHVYLIKNMKKKYPRLHVVMEDYFLYSGRAVSQINSRFETVRLLGILELYCSNAGIHYVFQRAADVMKRWSNDILEHKNIIRKEGRFLYLEPKGIQVCLHQVDSIRHAVHYRYFGKGAKKYGSI